MYDIVGDIHGHYDLLLRLLKKLDYAPLNGSYHHPSRKIIFTGDIINRGDKIRKTILLIKKMVEAGDAYCVLGNHELNAILYSTSDKTGKSLRKKLPRYKLPLMKTLDEFKQHSEEFNEIIRWFRTLPIYIELDGLRVAHGGWNDEYIKTIEEFMNGESKLKKKFLKQYLTNPILKEAVTGIIKGKEFVLPNDFLLKDNKGIIRRNFRIKWWEKPAGKTFNKLAFGNRFELPEYSIPKEILPKSTPYPLDAPPVFLGHYCIKKQALIFQDNICCIDTCVVRTQKLTAYRWNGEQKLSIENIVQI